MKDIQIHGCTSFATCLIHIYVHLLSSRTQQFRLSCLFLLSLRQNHGLVVPNFGRFGWQAEHWRALETTDFVLWRFMILISKVARRFRNNCVGPCGTWAFFHFDVFSNHNIGSSNPSQLLCFSQVCRLRYFDFLDSFCRRYHVSISRCLGRGVHQKPTELWRLRGAETKGGLCFLTVHTVHLAG